MADKSKTKVRFAILLSRCITRSGDHAWDLALPLTIIGIFPNTLAYVSAYFISVRFISALLLSYLGRSIDKTSTIKTIKVALNLQLLGVVSAAIFINLVAETAARGELLMVKVFFILLIACGTLAKVGYALMNITISFKWIPRLFAKSELTGINGQIARADFAMEIIAPLVAGLILSSRISGLFVLGGFHLIVAWNVASFFLEGLILVWIQINKPILQSSESSMSREIIESSRSLKGVELIMQQRIWPVIISYTLLWITVLTPHHALLTAFLKSEWKIDELSIGAFRAGGAIAGIIASMIFSGIANRISTPLTTTMFISLQAVSITLCCVGFYNSAVAFPFVASCILVSRIGLYGFILGDTQLRQTEIAEEVRGQVNAAATSINEFAGLILYVVGLIFWSPDSFNILACLSAAAITSGAILTTSWYLRISRIANRT